MAAIAVAPADDAPRLVYADWLQERGEETKADYLRTVVRLMHSPENQADVTRVIDLAKVVNEEWRTRVAGRFEVVAQGSKLVLVIAYMVAAAWKIALQEKVPFWNPERPVALRNSLTREGAEELAAPLRVSSLGESAAEDPPIKFNVRPMTEESGPTLFVQ
jgi:uncharacterized protein (TIGR02996 family)